MPSPAALVMRRSERRTLAAPSGVPTLVQKTRLLSCHALPAMSFGLRRLLVRRIGIWLLPGLHDRGERVVDLPRGILQYWRYEGELYKRCADLSRGGLEAVGEPAP